MTPQQYDVAIVGGGVAGLTVAYRLRQQRPDLRVIVLEAASQPGGKVRTSWVDHPDGRFLIEAGPDCFLAQKPWARELTEELGLGDELIPVNEMPRAVSILKHGRIIDWPSGVSLLAPTEFLPFLRTPLISPLGKARMALDLVMPAKQSMADESIATFVRRRLGNEALEWIAEPLMAGIYNADPGSLSMQATFPNLLALEREHGSLIRGLRSARKSRTANGVPRPVFLSLRSGMQSLIDGLIGEVDDVVRCDSIVTSLSQADARFSVQLDGQPAITANNIVLAVPAAVASNLTDTMAPGAANVLGGLRTASSGTLSLAFPSGSITRALPGYGLVIPGQEWRPFNAITVVSKKFPGRAPDGWTLLRLFFGGARSPETMRVDDQQLVEMAMAELRLLFGVTQDPAFFAVTRWPVGNPIYEVGHLDRITATEEALPPGIFLTGSAYRGVGIPDVVRDANDIVRRLIESTISGGVDLTRQTVAV